MNTETKNIQTMRKYLIVIMLVFANSLWAQTSMSNDTTSNPSIQIGNYKYQVAVNRMNIDAAISTNQKLDSIKRQSQRGWTDLGRAIATAYKSSLTQKTVNATSNLVSLGVTYVTELIKAPSRHFQEWSRYKQKQCSVKNVLSFSEQVDDFYYLPSPNGALDPLNLKFNGFTCRKFIEVPNFSRHHVRNKPVEATSDFSSAGRQDRPILEDSTDVRMGNDVFYLRCSLRTDSLGIAHLANHSKFMLEVDTLVFYPRYSNVPNGQRGRAKEFFNFDKYTNLQLQINVKVFSSWVNEAIMMTSDQQLGEFNINVVVNRKDLQELDTDSAFVYVRGKTGNDSCLNITGDSFVVPRSYVGTYKEPMWGTGQYKLAIEVAENCQLNARHYIKTQHIGNGEAVNFANLPEYRKWKKDVWREEWRTIDAIDTDESFWQQAWKQIKVAYVGDNWVKELVDPVATQFYDFEAKELKELFKLDEDVSLPASGSSVGTKPSGGGGSGGASRPPSGLSEGTGNNAPVGSLPTGLSN